MWSKKTGENATLIFFCKCINLSLTHQCALNSLLIVNIFGICSATRSRGEKIGMGHRRFLLFGGKGGGG